MYLLNRHACHVGVGERTISATDSHLALKKSHFLNQIFMDDYEKIVNLDVWGVGFGYCQSLMAPLFHPPPQAPGGGGGGKFFFEKKLVSIDSELSKTFESLISKKMKFSSTCDFFFPQSVHKRGNE